MQESIHMFAIEVASAVMATFVVKGTPGLHTSARAIGHLIIAAARGKKTLVLSEVVITHPELRPFLSETRVQFKRLFARWSDQGRQAPLWSDTRFWGYYPRAFMPDRTATGTAAGDKRQAMSVYGLMSLEEVAMMVHSLHIRNTSLARKVLVLTANNIKTQEAVSTFKDIAESSKVSRKRVVSLKRGYDAMEQHVIEMSTKVRVMEDQLKMLVTSK